MEAFTQLTGVAAPLPIANVDTDKIIPARFMKTIQRAGLGVNLFDGLRYDENGKERPDFVLNQAPYRNSKILLAYENFGCGSSREHAPWALLDFGIRCIIAPSFADIFHANCFKNGILPVKLPQLFCEKLVEDARRTPGSELTVDLERLIVRRPDGEEIPFTVDSFRRELLLKGFDDISVTMQHIDEITEFENRRGGQSWMYPTVGSSAS